MFHFSLSSDRRFIVIVLNMVSCVISCGIKLTLFSRNCLEFKVRRRRFVFKESGEGVELHVVMGNLFMVVVPIFVFVRSAVQREKNRHRPTVES